jgi:pimeloyl-ACP methyl ester carboxylesterase
VGVEGRAATWRGRGAYFRWAPTGAGAAEVAIFHVESGRRDSPVLLLVHGFPTCSVDWFELVDLLQDRYRVCALDFPGYGFSDKPVGWGYSLARDADLLDFYVREVIGAESPVVLAHDRGSSVALNYVLAADQDRNRCAAPVVKHLVLTNGNIFLPLSNLTDFQRLVLDGSTAPAVLGGLTPAMLAAGMGTTTFSPPRAAEHPNVAALTATFAHDDGIKVLHETIQYLAERAEREREWLELLAQSDVPTTIIWGLLDTVSPPRVATHVWDHFLMRKPGPNRFYLVSGANHYLQVDQAAHVAAAFLHAQDLEAVLTPGPIGTDDGSPILVDWSRPRLPQAFEVLTSSRSR